MLPTFSVIKEYGTFRNFFFFTWGHRNCVLIHLPLVSFISLFSCLFYVFDFVTLLPTNLPFTEHCHDENAWKEKISPYSGSIHRKVRRRRNQLLIRCCEMLSMLHRNTHMYSWRSVFFFTKLHCVVPSGFHEYKSMSKNNGHPCYISISDWMCCACQKCHKHEGPGKNTHTLQLNDRIGCVSCWGVLSDGPWRVFVVLKQSEWEC